jgi:hypothetical protein
MDESESLVRDYLQYQGFERIVYQPDGNIPPDFLVDDRIAVEVRRLNENELTESGELRGLETLRISTERKLCKLLHSLGHSASGSSWFVGLHLKRPVPRWKYIEPELRRQLEKFRDNENSQKLCVIKVAEGLEIEIFHKASRLHRTCFLHGVSSDSDTGGFVFGNTQRNLRLCVQEKMRKIAPVRHKYSEWWLVFVDHIGFGVEDCDQELFRKHLGIEHDLDRVILLSRQNARWAFELPSKSATVL